MLAAGRMQIRQLRVCTLWLMVDMGMEDSGFINIIKFQWRGVGEGVSRNSLCHLSSDCTTCTQRFVIFVVYIIQ